MSLLTDASLIVTPNAKKAGKLYALKGADLDVVRNTTATYVGADGLIKTALANEVRFDYTNGSCPSVLVEPQRTNLFTSSEQFDNASWYKTRVSVSSNQINSPKNELTADLITESAEINIHFINKEFSVTSGVTYTCSVFLKSKERNKALIALFNGFPLTSIQVDLQNGIVTTGTGTPLNAFIKEYTDNWFRVGFSLTSISSTNASFNVYTSIDGLWNNRGYLGDGTSGIYIWGAQIEAGANATSYIPTVASAVTRNADVISKTGISDLIGQTEGTIYVELNLKNLLENQNRRIISLSNNNSASENIQITFTSALTNTIRAVVASGGNFPLITSSQITNLGKLKISLTYSNTTVFLYINGVKQGINLGAVTKPVMNFISLGSLNNSDLLNDNINSVLIFPTALTNQQCIDLTTI